MKEYINTKELQEMTGLTYRQALRVINRVREQMKEKGYYIPQSKEKIALKWLIKKELGIK